MDETTPFRVLVIGGGNTGLALAQGFRKANISYIIFERDSSDDFHNKARDWGMLLHWGAQYLLPNLPSDMQARINEPTVDNFYNWSEGGPVVHMNGKTGEIILRIPSDDPIIRVSRKKLRKFLSEGIDIQCDKRLSSITTDGDTVTALFEDGSQETGNLIIGADGSRSKVRQILVGVETAKPEILDYTIINYSAGSYTAEQVHLLRTVHPIINLAHHPDNKCGALLGVLDNPDPSKPELTKFQVYQSWKGRPFANELTDPKERLRVVKERAKTFCEPFRTAALAIDAEVILPIDQGAQWKPIWWNNMDGKVTLAGDAAHSMLSHCGQGLNNAMQDSAQIVDAVKATVFGGKSLKGGIDGYEAEMRPRGVKEVELSFQTAEMGSDWVKFQESPIFKLGLSKEKN